LNPPIDEDFAHIKVSVAVNPNPVGSAEELSGFIARFSVAPTGDQFAV